MEYKNLALLVPLSPELRRLSGAKETEQRARAQVWKTVTGLLNQHMGTMFQSFMPALYPWENFPLRRPFGVLLGPREPIDFKFFYVLASMSQLAEREMRKLRLYKGGKSIGELKLDEHVTLSVKDYSNITPEIQRDFDWLMASDAGALTADCGLYHCGLGSSRISKSQEDAVFAAVADYALCVVALGIEEGQSREGN